MPARPSVLSVENYVVDVLLRDLVGHDRHPAAFLVYLHLYLRAQRGRRRTVAASLREMAADTGLAKSAVQTALANLQRRELIRTHRDHPTATSVHTVLRPWRR